MAQIDDRFPRVSIEGGPAGRGVSMTMDGVLMKGVTRFVLTGDVNEALRLKTFQIVKAVVSVEAEHSHAIVVRVLVQSEDEATEATEVATATADTLWEALEDCAKQVRANTNS